MKVHITLTAAKAGGKTHLAKALEEFLTYHYKAAATLEVTIIEQHPLGPGVPEPVHGHSFVVRPVFPSQQEILSSRQRLPDDI